MGEKRAALQSVRNNERTNGSNLNFPHHPINKTRLKAINYSSMTANMLERTEIGGMLR